MFWKYVRIINIYWILINYLLINIYFIKFKYRIILGIENILSIELNYRKYIFKVLFLDGLIVDIIGFLYC